MPSTSTKPSAPQVHRLGETVEVTGRSGNPLKLTPTGVFYHKGDKRYGLAEQGVFAAVGYTLEAVSQPDTIPAPVDGAGFELRWDDITLTSAASPPWAGRVNEASVDQEVQPGETDKYIETFDIPAPGGILIYVNPGTKKQIRWQLPKQNSGKGYGGAVRALQVLKVPI